MGGQYSHRTTQGINLLFSAVTLLPDNEKFSKNKSLIKHSAYRGSHSVWTAYQGRVSHFGHFTRSYSVYIAARQFPYLATTEPDGPLPALHSASAPRPSPHVERIDFALKRKIRERRCSVSYCPTFGMHPAQVVRVNLPCSLALVYIRSKGVTQWHDVCSALESLVQIYQSDFATRHQVSCRNLVSMPSIADLAISRQGLRTFYLDKGNR